MVRAGARGSAAQDPVPPAAGLTLAAIRRVLDGELGLADAGLAAAVAAERADPVDGELLNLDAFAASSGVPASSIQAVEREGIRIGHQVDGETRYTTADIELVRTALRLLDHGLPLGDLLSLARDADDAMRGLADRAVDLFDEHVRKRIRDTASDPTPPRPISSRRSASSSRR